MKLAVSFEPVGRRRRPWRKRELRAVERMVPLTAAEVAQAEADAQSDAAVQDARAEQETTYTLALRLAEKVATNTATPAETRQALVLCLHGVFDHERMDH